MITQRYEWQRYLCPVSEDYARTADGYLVSPGDGDLPLWSPNVHLRTLADLLDLHLLIVLGEAGIGKTTFLEETEAFLQQQHGEHSVLQERFILFQTLTDVRTELFESDKVRNWRTGTGRLYIMFDGVDETPADRVPAIISGLVRGLNRLTPGERDRLHLYIASHPIMLSHEFSKDLSNCWSQREDPVFALAVLSLWDVVVAAKTHGLARGSL